MYTRVRYEISAGSVFVNLKNVLCSKWKFDPLKYFPSHRVVQSIKIHGSFECNLTPGTSYRSNKWIHSSNNQFMNRILTCFGCDFPSETCKLF